MKLKNIIDRFLIRQPKFRRLLTAILVKDKNQKVRIAGTRLLINTRREHGYLRASKLIKTNSTLIDEVPTLMNLFALIQDGDTFVDVGANIGLYTHSISRLFTIYPNLQICAIEAHPDTFKRLSHFKSNRITYYNCAVSNKSGHLRFVDGAVSHVFTTLEKKTSYNIDDETMTIESKRLDDFGFASNSLVVKIDVEGQEMEVLHGATCLLNNNMIRIIYLDGFDDPTIPDFLLAKGFKLFEGRNLKPFKPTSFTLFAIKE